MVSIKEPKLEASDLINPCELSLYMTMIARAFDSNDGVFKENV